MSRTLMAITLLVATGALALDIDPTKVVDLTLAHLDRLPATGATLIALPMPIGGGSGGPLRAIAILP